MTTQRGRCLCKAVTFEYTGAVNWCGHFHCESCRRNTSLPFTTWLGVPKMIINKSVSLNRKAITLTTQEAAEINNRAKTKVVRKRLLTPNTADVEWKRIIYKDADGELDASSERLWTYEFLPAAVSSSEANRLCL